MPDMKHYIPQLLLAVLIIIFALWTSTHSTTKSEEIKNTTTTLQKIKNKKQLDIVILNSPTVYYIGAEKKLGFEYELISSYAKYIGVDLNLTVVHTVEDALQKTREKIGDITVASISMTEDRKQEFTFGPLYDTVQEELICNNKINKNKIKDVQDISDLNIMVGKDTSYEKTMKEISLVVDGLEFNTTSEYSSEQLLELVYKKKIDCTVVDSNIFSLNQRYYPELSKSLILGERQSLAWIIQDDDGSLNDSLYTWINSFERLGHMAELKDFYYSFLSTFDYYDTKIFYKRLKTRFPKYEKDFKGAAKKYNVPWMILAAQAYQESHWNPHAKSHTGVRGMMMITLTTAKQIGVKNRLNAKESIYGGAKYLKSIEKRLPEAIKGKSRWAFTLAAYNVGMGHIHDAQTLARELNKNPYRWNTIKEVLPLLSQKKYYKNLKHGYARGNEPVKYVTSIQNYLDLIHNKEI